MPAEFHLIDFVAVLSQAKEFGAHVSRVPYCHTLISTTSDHQVLIEGRIVNRHDLCHVSINSLGGAALSHVPNFELLIVAD